MASSAGAPGPPRRRDMSNRDTWADARHRSARDVILAGDCSVHKGSESQFVAYAMVATSADLRPAIDAAIEKYLTKFTLAGNLTEVEIHAKDIWNGSARRKGPLRGLGTKQDMLAFFRGLALLVGRMPLEAVVAVEELPLGIADGERVARKRLLLYSAGSRLDRNIDALAGCHLGQAPIFLDPEDDHIMWSGKHGRRGFLSDVGIDFLGSERHSVPVMYPKIDLEYFPTPARSMRLIQIADVMAYFVGKYVALHSRILARVQSGNRQPDQVYYRLAHDCNFSLRQIELLDVEVATPMTQTLAADPPAWLAPAVRQYRPLLDMGIDFLVMSLREAIDPSGRRTGWRADGIDYWLTFFGPTLSSGQPHPLGTNRRQHAPALGNNVEFLPVSEADHVLAPQPNHKKIELGPWLKPNGPSGRRR